MTHALLAGHPNSGKSELFNALTKSNASVGNWSGVTVEMQAAPLTNESGHLIIQDLPGLYSLMDLPEGADEKLALVSITQSQPALIINVINACQLERQLFLTSELLELGVPMIVILNMTALAKAQGISIYAEALSEQLNCIVLTFEPDDAISLDRIKQAIDVACQTSEPSRGLSLSFPAELMECIAQYQAEAIETGCIQTRSFFEATQRLLHQTEYVDADLHIANARYTAVHQIASTVQICQRAPVDQLTARLDKFFLNRYLGLPLFLFVMYSMFFFSIHVGGVFQDFFDLASSALFVQFPAQALLALHAPNWCIQLISDGIGKGLNTTLTFIPVLGAMYLCLTFLEASGYMARAAFVMDRFMRFLGLPGKAFVPLIIGFGCNVPAILATRTLESKRDRYLTIFMSPFMSCSARLTIYTVFVSAFFPDNGQNLIFCLYLLGVAVAIITGLILQKTLFPSQLAPLLLELPPYHRPNFKRLWRISKHRLMTFLKRAGTLILPVCFLLSLMNLIPAPVFNTLTYPSLLAFLGHQLTPLFEPMGLDPENWPATVGLLTGILAKEVVIGSLNTLYEQMGHLTLTQPPLSISQTLWAALHSIPEHLSNLWQAFLHPFTSQIKTPALPDHTSVIIQQHFKTAASVYAYLTFILLYLPCVSTMAAIKQETSSRWMWFSILWSFCVAYGLAVLVYQSTTFSLHPLFSLSWMVGIPFCFCGFLYSLRYAPKHLGVQHAV